MLSLPSFLFTPQQLKRMREAEERAEKETFEYHKHRAEPWDLWKTKPPRKISEPLIIKGETYKIDHKVFDLKPVLPGTDLHIPETQSDAFEASPHPGMFRYYHHLLPRGRSLRAVFTGRDRAPDVFFTTDISIPTLLEFDNYEWKPWMSLTPAELFSQRSGIRFCRGNVVIGGLGLGWFAKEVVKRSQVSKVLVVEQSRVILDWYGERLCKELGVEVVCDDIWNVVGKQPVGTRYAIDIWAEWHQASYDSDLRRARDEGHEIWAWGSARGER